MTSLVSVDRSEPAFFVRLKPQEGGSEDLSLKVRSFNFTDSEKKADKLVLAVDNDDLSNFDDPTWAKGNVLEFVWGYAGRLSLPREAVIEKVTGFRTLKVEAHAKSVLLDREVKNQIFENVSRSNVAGAIAADHGFTGSRQDIEETEEIFPSITQARLTDARFLKRLADREGFEFYVDFDGFHFHQRRIGQKPIRVYRYSIDPDATEITNINITNDVTAKPGAVRLKGRDPVAKKDIDQRGSDSETERDAAAPVIEIVSPETGETFLKNLGTEDIRPTPQTSDKSVKREADARFRKTQQTTVKLTMSAVGDQDQLAKTVIEIRNISKRLSGLYYVKEAAHTISNGYSMTLTCIRDGHSEFRGLNRAVDSAKKTNKATGEDADPNKLEEIESVDPETGDTKIEYKDSRGRRR